MKQQARQLTDLEKDLMSLILSLPGSSDYVESIDLDSCLVKEVGSGGSIKFVSDLVKSNLRQQKFPVEAQALDEDGVMMHALIFTCMGKIDELEIYKEDSSKLLAFPKMIDGKY